LIDSFVEAINAEISLGMIV